MLHGQQCNGQHRLGFGCTNTGVGDQQKPNSPRLKMAENGGERTANFAALSETLQESSASSADQLMEPESHGLAQSQFIWMKSELLRETLWLTRLKATFLKHF